MVHRIRHRKKYPSDLTDEQWNGSLKTGIREIFALVRELGGTISGEHGIGVQKIDFMARQFTADDLQAMRTLRQVFDPGNRCNPHKMFPGSKRCADLILLLFVGSVGIRFTASRISDSRTNDGILRYFSVRPIAM